MRSVVFGVLTALLLGLTPAAAAETRDWVRVNGRAQGEVEIDRSRVIWGIGYVYSWVRVTFPSDQRSSDGKSTFRVSEMLRYDDCDGAAGIVEAHHYDREGKLVFEADERLEPMVKVGKGTASAEIAARVCAVEQPVGEATETLSVGPNDMGSWALIGESTLGRLYLETTTVEQIDDTPLIGFYSKEVLNKEVRSGRSKVRFVFREKAVDCQAETIFTFQDDFYDSRGRSVGGMRVKDDDVLVDRVFPDTDEHLLINAVCDTDIAKAVAAKEAAGSMGTAWLAPKGYLVTAAHVVADAKFVFVQQDGRPIGEAEVVASDPSNDIALLKPKFDLRPYAALDLAASPALLGEKVFTVGYPAPDALGYSVKMTSGEISSLAGNDVASDRMDDRRLMQVSVPVQSGNSGGPLIDEKGQVVGIVLSKQQMTGASEIAQNVNFALKIGYVRALMEDLPPVGPSRVWKAQGSVPQLVADVRTGVFMVTTEPASEVAAK